jgi:hypothetical protein
VAAPEKYDMTVYPTAGLVRSASDGARSHQVTLPSCDCGDFINRRGQLLAVDGLPVVTICKHIVEFMVRVGGWNRSPEPGVHEGLPRERAAKLLSSLSGVPADAVMPALDFACSGSFSVNRPGRSTVKIEVDAIGLYTVTIPA